MLVEIVFTADAFSLIIAVFSIIQQGCFIIAEQRERAITFL